MHVLLECDVLMQLIVSYIHDTQLSIWLSDTNSEWYSRMIKWVPAHLPETVQYAFQVGDVPKMKKWINLNDFSALTVSLNDWHIKTWNYFADNHLNTLRMQINDVSSIQSSEKLIQIKPFFKLASAEQTKQYRFLCSTINTLDFDTFVELYQEYKFDCSQPLLCFLCSYYPDCRKKSIIKWLVDQLKTVPTKLITSMTDHLRFEIKYYYITKYLMLSGRMDTTTRNKLFHQHMWQARFLDDGENTYFQKMTLMLWQKNTFLLSYLIPFVENDPRINACVRDNCLSKFVPFDYDDHYNPYKIPHIPNPKRMCNIHSKQLFNDVWIQLHSTTTTNCDMKAEEDTDNIDSDPENFYKDIDTDDDTYDGHTNAKFRISKYNVRPSELECVQRNFHDTVFNNMSSGLAREVMSNMSIVHNWSDQEFCSAFENTCIGGRRSLAFLLWQLAPPTLHPELCKYLVFAFQHNDIAFLEFAWEHASEFLIRSMFAAARFALLCRHKNTWHFLFDKGLLTEAVLFDDKYKLWHKLCFTHPDFLKLVWRDTPAWRSHFDVMIATALTANKRWIVMFLNKQHLVLDQTWLRKSIVKLTRLNLYQLLEQIHEPKTLPLTQVQMCYEVLMKHDFWHMTTWWWTSFPLTREQLLGVPNVTWYNMNSYLMELLWSDHVANVDELREYMHYKVHDHIYDFDMDLETSTMWNTT